MTSNTVRSPDPSRIDQHRSILAKKRMIREVFQEFHHLLWDLDQKYFRATPGVRVELGAGSSPMRDTYPEVLSTDIVPADGLDAVVDAERMQFEAGSVRALYGQNCFHHFPHPALFLKEVERVVHPGGGVILIEPHYGPFASVVFPRLFKQESFDKRMKGWEADIVNEEDGANQALSYIVFKRDRADFNARFPKLEIVLDQPLSNYVRYVASGGLNFPQLMPDFMIPVLRGVENILSPFAGSLALHHVVVLRRTEP